MASPRMQEIPVDWKNTARVTSVLKGENAFIFRVRVQNKTVAFSVTFPTLGGVRLTQSKGFFDCDGQAIAYSGKKVLKMTAGGETALFSRDPQHGWVLCVQNTMGETLLRLTGEALLLGLTQAARPKIARMQFSADLEEREVLYGVGERYAALNLVGSRAYLWNVDTDFGRDLNETYQNIPLMHSTRGYTLFCNTMYGGWADFGYTVPGRYTFDFNGPDVDIFVFTSTPAENMNSYTLLTGRPVLPPKWAFRYWMGGGLGAWKYEGRSFAENLQAYLDGYAALGIHHIAAVYGESGPCEQQACYEMLKPYGTHMLSWNYPGCEVQHGIDIIGSSDPKDLPFQMFQKNGKWEKPDPWYDFTHPNIQKILHDRYDRLFDWGLKGTMVDFGEYISADSRMHNGKDGNAIHNEHSYWYAKAMQELFAERCGDDHILFQRSACPGAQHFSGHFGGDQACTFEGMRQAFYGGLNAAASSLSTWGSDIGGLGGQPTVQTYIRWLQYGAFSPLMRTHSGGLGRNPWEFGDDAVAIFQKLYWWRENMLPYLYSHAVEASKTGVSIMRAMPFAYPQEERTLAVEDQYMFGSEMLVAPVLQENMQCRTVVFPAGQWVNLWTGERVDGGRRLQIPTPLQDIPVFLRAGAALVLELPAETLRPCENMEEVPRVPALLVTPAAQRREVVYHADNDTAYRFVTDTSDGAAVTVTNTDGMPLGALLVYGIEATRVLADGAEVPFTAGAGKTTVRLADGFQTVQVW